MRALYAAQTTQIIPLQMAIKLIVSVRGRSERTPVGMKIEREGRLGNGGQVGEVELRGWRKCSEEEESAG